MNEHKKDWPKDQRLWSIFHEFWFLAGDIPKVPPQKLTIEDMEREAGRVASMIRAKWTKEDAIYKAREDAMKEMERYINGLVTDKTDPEYLKRRQAFNDAMGRIIGPRDDGRGKRPLPEVVN